MILSKAGSTLSLKNHVVSLTISRCFSRNFKNLRLPILYAAKVVLHLKNHIEISSYPMQLPSSVFPKSLNIESEPDTEHCLVY